MTPYNGIDYRPGMMIVLEIDIDTGNPIFGKVRHVFVEANEHVYLLVDIWSTLWFESRYHAYAVTQETETEERVRVISITALFDYHPHHAIHSYDTSDKYLYIVPRYRY